MHIDANDVRPPSLLVKRHVDTVAVFAGATMAVVAHLALPLALFSAAAILAALGIFQPPTEEPIEERQIVEARFVKLGRPLDPRKLPNRHVPRLSTAPEEGLTVSKNPQHRVLPDGGRPPDPEVAALVHIGDRAQAFAELAELREQEGREDGIEDGTETQNARAGDIYAGQLYAFFRRGWTTPTLINPDALRGLVTDVDLSITGDARVGGYRLRHSSGNPLFDQSVLDRLQQLRESGEQLPQPPSDISRDYLGQTIGLRFRGRDAR